MQRRVAFQGERGANSEDAVVRLFGEVEVLPCRTLPEVFAAVAAGEASEGLVPVENSRAGSIHETYDLLLDNPLHITGEITLRISHCLQALPGQRLEDIRVVYSHPQALAQCDDFLRRLGADKVAVYDTAGSARMLRDQGVLGAAAIASRRAALLYGLEILAESIETSPDNYTRFYTIAREPAQRTSSSKTALVLATQDRPGALFWCLGALAYRQVNLSKLESRPSRRRPWEYVFYLEVEGHTEEDPLREALAELETKTTVLRVLGSFPAAPGAEPTPA